VSAYRESKGKEEKVEGSYFAHTSVIVRDDKDGEIELCPAKMGTIKTPTEDGTEERTTYDRAKDTVKSYLPFFK
jgi:hypothetical protein